MNKSPKANATNANGKTPDMTAKKKIVLSGEAKNARRQTDHTPVKNAAKYRMIEPNHDSDVFDTSGS